MQDRKAGASNARLDRNIAKVRSAAEQDRLAALTEAHVARHVADPDSTAEELGQLKRCLAEPFNPAPEHEVRKLFAPTCGQHRQLP